MKSSALVLVVEACRFDLVPQEGWDKASEGVSLPDRPEAYAKAVHVEMNRWKEVKVKSSTGRTRRRI